MKALISIGNNREITVDLDQPICISIPIKEGAQNPNCYWAEPVKFETIKADGFIGSVKEGGSVNYQKLQITPHGNGTHVEGLGHITDLGATINKQLTTYHFYSKLISLAPTKTLKGDFKIELTQEIEDLELKDIKALIIRTLPNSTAKLTKNYSGNNPPFIDSKLIEFLVEQEIEHLLIDLPSVDKEVDNGALLSHRAFWNLQKKNREHCTITELIFVPDNIPDANYLLNLQTINLEMDAAPCNPTLYKIEESIIISR